MRLPRRLISHERVKSRPVSGAPSVPETAFSGFDEDQYQTLRYRSMISAETTYIIAE